MIRATSDGPKLQCFAIVTLSSYFCFILVNVTLKIIIGYIVLGPAIHNDGTECLCYFLK